jgi:glycosyltransferase involved in cell wall biosynthesis
MPPATRFPVLFVNLARTWGGGQQWHLAMAQALAEREWPVELLAWPDSPLARRAAAARLPVWPQALRATSWLVPGKIPRLRRGLLARRVNAVVLDGSHELKTVGVVAHRLGVPRVILRRGLPQPLSPGWVNRWLLRRVATRLVANSQATLDAMAGGFPAAMERLRPRVIYNGVEPAGWQPPATRPPTGRIAVVGRLEWEKGVDRAIQALHLLRRRMGHATLRIVGEGSQRANLEALAAELGLADAVEFTGHSTDVRHLLNECDVLVLPSRWEGFGFVLVEAMLLELPTVAFDLPAAREIVVDGTTGLLVPPDDIDALAGALGAVLATPGRARTLGMAGRLRAMSQFTLDRAAAELERVLQEPP